MRLVAKKTAIALMDETVTIGNPGFDRPSFKETVQRTRVPGYESL
jgi:hypothetical protein